MQIAFRTKGLEKAASEFKEATQKYGEPMARKLGQRIKEIVAAETLADLHLIPATRCHELAQNRKGQFAVDLVQPYRLIFEPLEDPVPRKADGGIDLEKVSAVRIIEVEDYHGK